MQNFIADAVNGLLFLADSGQLSRSDADLCWELAQQLGRNRSLQVEFNHAFQQLVTEKGQPLSDAEWDDYYLASAKWVEYTEQQRQPQQTRRATQPLQRSYGGDGYSDRGYADSRRGGLQAAVMGVVTPGGNRRERPIHQEVQQRQTVARPERQEPVVVAEPTGWVSTPEQPWLQVIDGNYERDFFVNNKGSYQEGTPVQRTLNQLSRMSTYQLPNHPRMKRALQDTSVVKMETVPNIQTATGGDIFLYNDEASLFTYLDSYATQEKKGALANVCFAQPFLGLQSIPGLDDVRRQLSLTIGFTALMDRVRFLLDTYKTASVGSAENLLQGWLINFELHIRRIVLRLVRAGLAYPNFGFDDIVLDYRDILEHISKNYGALSLNAFIDAMNSLHAAIKLALSPETFPPTTLEKFSMNSTNVGYVPHLRNILYIKGDACLFGLDELALRDSLVVKESVTPELFRAVRRLMMDFVIPMDAVIVFDSNGSRQQFVVHTPLIGGGDATDVYLISVWEEAPERRLPQKVTDVKG